MPRHILITGGLGFIGSNLAHRCVELGYDVTLLDNLAPDCGSNPTNLEGIADRVQFIEGDIRDPLTCKNAIRGKDAVFHCAALTSHLNSMRDPRENVSVNCVGTITLLDALRLHNPAARFVYVGTSTQTGPMLLDRVDECHPEFPMDMYSANKSVAEKYVLIYARAYGLPASVVRFANVYGPRAHIKTASLGFVNYFIGLALLGRNITIFGDGSQMRNLSYVGDCVEAMLKAADAPAAAGEVFFATADEHFSVAQIAQSIVEAIGGQLHFETWPPERKVIDVGNMLIDNSKIKKELGWSPATPFLEGLTMTRDYFRQYQSAYL